ncbi:hypothetical protein MRBLMN1_000032 [Chitinophaga ginsengisegetis]|uniref:hypothetical protein n=1 Tax=Chitinophaga ginsengisegetis TaxID=393003 RepID=UPI0034347731
MKNKISLIAFSLLTLAASCRKEEETVFPDYDKNWLVVADDPNDATIHANYLFYKETGIPIYINDTIGSQQRRDVFGHDYTYYEVLSMSYSLGGLQSGAPPIVQSFTYCSKADAPAALDFLRAEIIPALPKGVHIPSILLVDTLSSNAFGKYAFKGFNTIVIGAVPQIPGMNEATRAAYKGAILRAFLTNAVLSDKYSATLEKFYNASRKFVTSRDVYGVYQFQLASLVTGLPPGVAATPQAIGFLGTDPRNTYYTPISTWMDVCMYLEAALGNSEAQFKQLYGNQDNIMIKYNYIKQILTDMGVPLK